MASSNGVVYSLAFSLLYVNALKTLLPDWEDGGAGAKAVFSVTMPETHKGNGVVFRIINPPIPEFIQQNVTTQTVYDLDIMYWVTKAYQTSDWTVIEEIKTLLAGYRNLNYMGYLIDIIADRPLPSVPMEVNAIRYTVEGFRFQVIVREYI